MVHLAEDCSEVSSELSELRNAVDIMQSDEKRIRIRSGSRLLLLIRVGVSPTTRWG